MKIFSFLLCAKKLAFTTTTLPRHTTVCPQVDAVHKAKHVARSGRDAAWDLHHPGSTIAEHFQTKKEKKETKACSVRTR